MTSTKTHELLFGDPLPSQWTPRTSQEFSCNASSDEVHRFAINFTVNYVLKIPSLSQLDGISLGPKRKQNFTKYFKSLWQKSIRKPCDEIVATGAKSCGRSSSSPESRSRLMLTQVAEKPVE